MPSDHHPPRGGASLAGGLAAPPLAAWAIPAAIFDQTGRLCSCNAAFETLSGFAALEGLRPDLLHLRNGAGDVADLFDVAATMDLPGKGVAALTRADGNVLDVAWTLGLWGEQGEALYLLTATDITDEKCLTCTIKSSRDKYRQAFDEQTELVCRFEPDSTILFVNDAYARAFDQSPRQMIGTRLTDQMSPADAARFLEYLQSFTVEDYIRDGEESFELAAGILCHQWWRRRAIFDHHGHLVAFQSVGRDITDSKRLQAERVRLERIVSASPVIGLRLRYAPGWPVEYVSPNLSVLTGWTVEELTSGRLGPLGLIHPDDRAAVAATLRDLVREQPDSLPRPVFRLQTRNDHVRWGEAAFQFERDPQGAITHLEAVINDVTAFVEAEARIRASELRLQDFAAAANDWFWELDDRLQIRWISAHATETRFFDLSPYVGRSYWEMVDVSENREEFRLHSEDLAQHRPFRDFRFTLPLKGSGPRRFSVSGRPVFAADGSFLGYRGTSTDVTAEERTAHALADSNRRYRAIFDAAQVALWEHDLNPLQQSLSLLRHQGVTDLAAWLAADSQRLAWLGSHVLINDVNAAAIEMHGVDSKNEIRGKTLAEIPGSLPLFEKMVLSLWNGETVIQVESPRRTIRGRMRHVLYYMRIPRTENEARHAVASILDITDRVVAEEQLRDSERRFRSMFDHAVPAMALIGIDGRWMRVNQALCTLLGQSGRALFGRSLWEQSHPDDIAEDRDWMARALSGSDDVLTRERRFIRSDGSVVWVYFSAVLLRDNSGEPLYFIGQAVNVNERKQAEQRAARAEAQLREAIAAMEDGFVLYDSSDRLVIWNARFEEIYDRIADLLKPGLHFEELVQACAERQQFARSDAAYPQWAEDRRAWHSGSGGVSHEEMLHDGRWVLIKETRTPDGGAVGVRADITSQKAREVVLRHAMEEARLADRAKSEFLANMSHELRTPLNAIIGFSEIISQELFGPVENASYREYATNIHESGRHLLQIIGDILDLSKIEAGELRLELEDVALTGIVEAARRMMHTRAEARGVKIVSEISEETPHLTGDELRLKQILLNLLSNAVKFSDKGGEIRIGWYLDEYQSLCVTVTDQGIGMDEQEVDVARSLFGQVQSAFTRQIEGTGLGIPLCIKLMAAHGGTLHIDSEKGVGTCVTMRFPRRSLWTGELPAADDEDDGDGDGDGDGEGSGGAA